MKNLTQVSKRVILTLQEENEDCPIFYQFETEGEETLPKVVNFSTQNDNGKTLSGNYSAAGGMSMNGQGIKSVSDLQIVNHALETMIEIINGTATISEES